MHPVDDPRITRTPTGEYATHCTGCGAARVYTSKSSARRALARGKCANCREYVQTTRGLDKVDIYKDGSKWCSSCPSCGVTQKYTRKDHAISSALCGWECRKCARNNGRHGGSSPVGDRKRLFNKYQKSAIGRDIDWELDVSSMFASYHGTCALTGWELDMSWNNCTASLDRIDSAKSYKPDNIQWVHSMVNMSKRHYSQAEFIAMCKAVAEHAGGS